MTSEPAHADDVTEWLDGYRARLWESTQLDELALAVTATITDEVVQLRAEPAIVRYLSQSTRAILRTYFTDGPLAPPEALQAPPAALEFGRAVARRGWPAPLLLQMYRIGQREVWLPIMAEASRIRDSELREKVLSQGFTHLSRSVDHVLGQILQAHAVDFELQARGAELTRVETVQALVAGEDIPIDEAVLRLGHNLHQQQTAMVLWSDEEDVDDQLPQMESAAGAIARAISGPKPLLIRHETRTWWGWVASVSTPPLDLVMQHFDQGPDTAIRVAIGNPATGLDGFRASHRDALLAQRVARTAAQRRSVTLYRDVELVACMSAEPEAMRALARRELGRLTADGLDAQRSRETLAAYLTEGSASRAAARLGVHKNTVLYRLQQLEEQLGHPADLHRPQLQVALQIIDIYGPDSH